MAVNPWDGIEAEAQEGGFRTVVARSAGDHSAVEVKTGKFSWVLDEPAFMGGHEEGPDPMTSFLGALCSCLIISLQVTARARQVPIGPVAAKARVNEKGFVKEVILDLTVSSNAPEEKVRTVVERAEKGCYIKGLLKESIHYQLNLNILP
jgi:uncharacterized OsmC-like protein